MVKFIGEVRQIQEVQLFYANQTNEFSKQIIVLETSESRTPIKIEFTNQNIKHLENVLIGSLVCIEVTIQGNYDKEDRQKVYNSFIAKSIINITNI